MGRLACVALLLAAAACPLAAYPQSYPARPIVLIVPFAAGGPADGLARNIAAAMSKPLKQPIVVDNVGGAGGTIGVARAAKAAPDGYTLLYHNLGMVLAPSLVAKLDYEPAADFEYLGIMSRLFTTLIARPNLPASTFPEFVSYLKAGNEKIMFANSGLGGISHLCGLLLASALQTRFTSVPYKGNAPAMNDLIAGRVDLMCDSAATAGPQIRAGRIRAIGIVGTSRNRELPDVPTLDEQGLKGLELENWSALYAPRGVPKPIMGRLLAAFQASLVDPDFRTYLEKSGYDSVPPEMATPAALARRVRSEVDRWGTLLRQAGISPQ
jgi:tripartite-type tricarboxylate transporter receptor subunit TctC